jgi:hypothetical protein
VPTQRHRRRAGHRRGIVALSTPDFEHTTPTTLTLTTAQASQLRQIVASLLPNPFVPRPLPETIDSPPVSYEYPSFTISVLPRRGAAPEWVANAWGGSPWLGVRPTPTSGAVMRHPGLHARRVVQRDARSIDGCVLRLPAGLDAV